jgi:ABC-type branched-subunit amino acid transport system substrate-binding protein/predicted negative regulator of RcsB-dependent stress response
MHRLSSVLILLVTGFLFTITHAQDGDPEASFQKARKLISENKVSAGQDILQDILKKNWHNPVGQKSVALLIEVYLKAKNYKQAAFHINRFLDYHSKSPLKDRILIADAMVKMNLGDFYSAAENLMQVNTNTHNPYLRSRSAHLIIRLLNEANLTQNEIHKLIEHNPEDSVVASSMYLRLALSYKSEGRYKAARYFCGQVLSKSKDSELSAQANNIITELESKGDGTPSLVVLAPLSGDFADFGVSALQGVLIAIDEARKGGIKISTHLIDTKGDPAIAVHKVRQVLIQDHIVGVVGPIMSAPATSVAAYLSHAHPEIPMITPTATGEGIAQLGSNIFQLNIPTSRLGQDIARYAVKCLDIYEFGILSPATEYGRLITESFIAEAERHGASILGTEYYQEGGQDYKTQFNILRSRKFDLDSKRKLVARGYSDADRIFSKQKREWMEDSTLYFPGFFLPASDPQDVTLLARQRRFYKLGGQLLGASGYYGRKTIIDGQKDVDSAYFSAPFPETSDNPEWMSFSKSYREKWNSVPDMEKVAGLSYDASKIILKAWQKSKSTPIKDQILSTKMFSGVYGPIIFDKHSGENQNSQIIRILKGKFHNAETCETD